MNAKVVKPEYFAFPGDERYDYTVVWRAHAGWLGMMDIVQTLEADSSELEQDILEMRHVLGEPTKARRA